MAADLPRLAAIEALGDALSETVFGELDWPPPDERTVAAVSGRLCSMAYAVRSPPAVGVVTLRTFADASASIAVTSALNRMG